MHKIGGHEHSLPFKGNLVTEEQQNNMICINNYKSANITAVVAFVHNYCIV